MVSIVVKGLQKNYTPGDDISCSLIIKSRKKCTIVSAKTNIVRQQRLRDTANNYETVRDENTVIATEKSGCHLVGKELPGLFKKTTVPVVFSLPSTSWQTVHKSAGIMAGSLAGSDHGSYVNSYSLVVEIGVRYGSGDEKMIYPGDFYFHVNAQPVPGNYVPGNITSKKQFIFGRGGIKEMFQGDIHHMTIMTRCNTTSFRSGETFTVQVAMINKTGRVLLGAPKMAYRQQFFLGPSIYNTSTFEGKVVKKKSPVSGKSGVDPTEEDTLRRILDENAGSMYSFKIPDDELTFDKVDGERMNTGVSGRELRIYPHFLHGSAGGGEFVNLNGSVHDF